MSLIARPIPRGVLIHSATHKYGGVTKDEWGNETLAGSRELARVRFEPSDRVVRTSSNTEEKLMALMFYDEQNSVPRGVTFALGDVIVWGSLSYRVTVVDLLHDGGRLHHQEIGLV